MEVVNLKVVYVTEITTSRYWLSVDMNLELGTVEVIHLCKQ